MARTFWDGFDNYASSAQLQTQWVLIAGAVSIDANGRFGGQRVGLISSNSYHAIGRAHTASDRRTAGVAFEIASADTDGAPQLLAFCTSAATGTANRQIGVAFNHGGSISIVRGASTVLWTSDEGVVDVGVMHFIGLSAIIHATAGSVGLTLDSEPLVELTGINTQGVAGTTDILYSTLTRSTNTASLYFDDFYHDDAYIAEPPERRVETLLVTGDGATLQLVPSTGATHFGVVDEVQASVTDYLSGSLPGEYDELLLADLSNTPAVIDGVRAAGFGLKADATARAWNYGIRSGATDALGSDIYLNAALSKDGDFFLTDPATAAAWTAGGVNALKLIPTVAI